MTGSSEKVNRDQIKETLHVFNVLRTISSVADDFNGSRFNFNGVHRTPGITVHFFPAEIARTWLVNYWHHYRDAFGSIDGPSCSRPTVTLNSWRVGRQ